mgnify:CR=1 FL=1
MEFDIFLGVAALVIAAVLTWCILRFFFAPRRGGARATLHDGVQQATITVRGGYSPDIVTMQAGIPITLRFDRKETGECTSHVVFPDLGTDTMLPGNETTEMSLPPLPAGDYPFACGMNMVHGLLRVEGETDSATKPDDGTASTGTAIPAGTPRMSAADALLAERQEAEERRQEIRHTGMLVAIGTVLTLPVFVPMMLMLVSHSLVPSWLMNPWLHTHHPGHVLLRGADPPRRMAGTVASFSGYELVGGIGDHRRIPVQHCLVLRLGADARGVERALLRVGRRSDHARSGRTPVGGESP